MHLEHSEKALSETRGVIVGQVKVSPQLKSCGYLLQSLSLETWIIAADVITSPAVVSFSCLLLRSQVLSKTYNLNIKISYFTPKIFKKGPYTYIGPNDGINRCLGFSIYAHCLLKQTYKPPFVVKWSQYGDGE